MTAGCGTPAYMAPETVVNLAKNTHRYGQAVDIYAYAIIMYESLELHPAWIEKKYTHLIFQSVEEGDRPPVKTSAPKPEYMKLMRACWVQDPEARPAFNAILDTIREIRGVLFDERSLALEAGASLLKPEAKIPTTSTGNGHNAPPRPSHPRAIEMHGV